MKKYTIVSNGLISEVEKEVAILLNDGWRLAGGISVAYTHEHAEHQHIPGHLVFTQALEK